jgi:hypothetical protein
VVDTEVKRMSVTDFREADSTTIARMVIEATAERCAMTFDVSVEKSAIVAMIAKCFVVVHISFSRAGYSLKIFN